MRSTAYVALGLLLAGCTTHADGTQSANKTAIGAVVGSVTGAALGNRLGGKDNRVGGTLIGAAAGAAAGGGIGYLMDRQEADLREQLASERMQHQVEVERVRDDLLELTLANQVSFDVDSAVVRPAFAPTLAKVAEVLVRYPDNQVTIVGYTDSTGSEQHNQTLSERRAAAVLAELTRLGVPTSRLRALGRGEAEPRASNATTSGREQNRRVEILLQSDTAQPIEAHPPS
jgi:outer membrane protein OmpA-like peptidoglycan-associated protein